MTTRLYSVRKNGSGFRIEVKTIGRTSKNRKILYVRGYSTSESAKDDIPRLESHLTTKRISSFEKETTVDEMKELLGPPNKRACSRKGKDAVAPNVKVMSGIIFIRLRRKLSWKYAVLKRKAVSENKPIVTKEEWMEEQVEIQNIANYAENVANAAKVEHEVKCQMALGYIHQRLRVLGERKVKNVDLIHGLRKSVFSGESYKRIREVVIQEPSDVIDLTEDLPKFTMESTTKVQLNRVTVQCITVLHMLQAVDQKNDLEKHILERFLSEIDSASSDIVTKDLMFKHHDILKKEFRSANTMIVLSEKVRALTGAIISSKKIREWYNDYLENESFEEDLRGCWRRDMFLEEYGYSLRFQIYLKNERKLTVDIATKELESIIQKDPPKTEAGLKAFESLRPFSRRTVHRWMLKLGCKYEKATVSYYTDTHEAEETKKDMKER
jgi:hypothetical protein